MDISSLESKSSRKTMPDVFVENIDGTDSSRPVHVLHNPIADNEIGQQITYMYYMIVHEITLITFILTKLKHGNFMVK